MSEDIFVVNVNDDEYESVDILDIESDIDLDERVHVIEVEDSESRTVETFDAFNALGEPNEQLKHQLLNGRDAADQHPITAITGLKDKLDDIEALKTVYSNEKQSADYYEWEDGNVILENRVGLFVTLCEDINKIRVCTENDDIFGVAVDTAGFIGGQSDLTRDYKYGLVTTMGVVHVRCERSINVGDYVVPNNYGYAKKNKSGYKVVGRHQIDGIEYVEIALVTPIGRICKLTDDVEKLGDRMDDAETNITVAINAANEAYNKAGEIGDISEEAIKNALEALEKSTDAFNRTDNFESILENANEIAAQARAISESAILSADRIHKEAVVTANGALTQVNNTQDALDELTNNMNPLITWEGENGKGISGFVHQVEADRITLGNLSKWDDDESGTQSLSGIISTVGKHEAILTGFTGYDGEVKETIAKVEQKADDNGASITSLVSSVDKYSVGEFSQAYGLTREQAQTILKPGYIYIPTEHKDKKSHSETMWENSEEKEKGEDGKKETNEFTPGDYYVWGINDQGNADWIEHSVGRVWISEAIPANSNGKLKFWYINSSTPPQNYEAYALYIWKDEQWEKVNILDGNVTNRVVSMIQQTQNEITLSVANARGDIATHKQWIDANGSQIQDLVTWSKGGDEDGEQYNLATIKQTADDAGATVAQVVGTILSEYDEIETWNAVGKNTNKVYYAKDSKKFWFYKYDKWNSTSSPTEAGLELNAASIVTAINNQTNETAINLNADRINLEGAVTANKTFSIDTNGYMRAIGGTIGGWIIEAQETETFGKVLFVGDSYTTNREYTSSDPEFAIGWPEYCAERLGLNEDRYYDAGVGGHGFATGSNQNFYFLTLLNNGINYVVNTKGWKLSEISHIIVGGGFNDKTVNIDSTYGRTVEDIKNTIITFDNRIKSLFTGYRKPKVILFAMGKSAISPSKNIDLEQYIYPAYEEQSLALGWEFYDIHNEWVGRDNVNFCADGFHPNEAGLKALGRLVASRCSKGKGRLYNPPIGDAYSDSGFYLSNRPGDTWAIEIGKRIYDYSNVGGTTTLNRAFLVSKEGNLWAQNAHISGVVNATGGTIGGWSLLNNAIYQQKGDSFTSGMTAESDAAHSVAFWAGWDGYGYTPIQGYRNYVNYYKETYPDKSDTDAQTWANNAWKSHTPFYVTHDGELHAKAGTIGGWELTSTSLKTSVPNSQKSFFIASASSNTGYWMGAKNSAGNYTFYITDNGVLHASNAVISGEISATSGSFSRDVKIGGRNISNWINENGYLNGSAVSYGSLNPTLINSDHSVRFEVFKAIEEGDSLRMYYIDKSAYLYVGKEGIGLFTDKDIDNDGVKEVSNITMSTSDSALFHAIQLSSSDGHFSGTWSIASAVSTTSDINKKNSIINIDDRYNTMFDSLVGRIYKYNDGTSGRLHTGFIAQEVKDAMDLANIDTSEFAGVVIRNMGSEQEDWYLRYEEFIALNTWQIQKAKVRIIELEERVTQLEELIKEK